MNFKKEFFQGRRILITGHTGFKGSWLCKMLYDLGSEIVGYALEPISPSLYQMANFGAKIHSVVGDIRDFGHLSQVFKTEKPEIVLHLAAQPIVRESYKNPRDTYEINMMGTVNLLECVRQSNTVVSLVNVTTDKVYDNQEWVWGYREDDCLNGFDPYSNSKSCSELITSSYKKSFFDNQGIAVSTMRAGNVIGGGDFSKDRIIPDCIRAVLNQEKIVVRNPYSVRPYQHVLEALYAYLLVVSYQITSPDISGCYNVGPEEKNCITTGELVQIFCDKWGEATWKACPSEGPHEADFLKLDCSKIKSKLGWKPVWNVEKAIEKTIEWTKACLQKKSVEKCMEQQLQEFWSEVSYQQNEK